MESLPYEQKVEILRRLPRDGLLAVAQTSTAMLDAASDERLWRQGGFDEVMRAGDEAPSVSCETDRREASTTTATDAESVLTPVGSPSTPEACVALHSVARWIARVLRFPAWALVPMITHERNSPFHLRVSLHPMKRALAAAEILRLRDDEETPKSAPRARAVAAAGEFAAVAERLAEVLREDADRKRRRPMERLRDERTRANADPNADPNADALLDAAAAAAEAIRAERGSLRVRLSASFLAGVHGDEPARTSRERREHETAIANANVLSRSPPPWSRFLRANAVDGSVALENEAAREAPLDGARAPDAVIARAPRPATPWSLLRARLVGESLAALAASRRVSHVSDRARTAHRLAWGGATRAVRAAARDEEPSEDGAVAPAAFDAAADARAGVAWPALVRDPRRAVDGRDDRPERPERPRGFIVGGCACRDGVAAVVHGALAAADPASFLDAPAPEGDGEDNTAAVRPSADHRAGATALAVLACAPRAHECALGAGRFTRLLGRASWTLRLRDALAARLDPADPDARPSFPRASPFHCPGATESDACLAMWLERSAVALEDGRARWEPREAAEAVTELAAAAAAAARATLVAGGGVLGDAPGAGAGAGASCDACGDSERLQAARRVMLRRARETLDECLVAVGVLERRGGA